MSLALVAPRLTHAADPLSLPPTAMVKVTGAFQKSTEIMKASNQLIKLPQLSATMREMSAEMMKAGIMEEMMDDTLEGLDDDELEDEADEEVDKVLYQLTDGKLGQVGKVGADLPVSQREHGRDRPATLGGADGNARLCTWESSRRKRKRQTHKTKPRCSGCKESCRIY